MTATNDLEAELRDLFDRQQRAIRPTVSGPMPPHTTVVWASPKTPRRRIVLAGAAAVAVLGITAGIAAVAARDDTGTGAASTLGTPEPFSVGTPQVTLTAKDFSIEVDGQTFTGDRISVNSDPGDPTYQTLELTWFEHGVEMRLNIYFAANGTNWWVSELRTYNGHQNGDWVYFDGPLFTTPLGSAYTGDVDLTASTDGMTSRLRISGMELQPFLSSGPGQGAPLSTASSAIPGAPAPSPAEADTEATSTTSPA
jgi:hypothetical protein